VIDRRRAPVFLIGFMGAGKTTVGRALADLLGREFVDLDEAIVASEGRSIARILGESGEPFFRALEAKLLASLRGRGPLVVACGGGTYAHAPSRALVDSLGTAVWLQVPLEVALTRCSAGETRPLLREPQQAAGLYRSRLPAYRSAPVHVDVEGLTPTEAAERIAARL
jgi:shikimate kinase